MLKNMKISFLSYWLIQRMLTVPVFLSFQASDRIRSDKQLKLSGRSQGTEESEGYRKKNGEGLEHQEVDGVVSSETDDTVREDVAKAGKDVDAHPSGQLQQPQDWSFITGLVRPRSAKRQQGQQPRYIFLTEEAAWEPGQYTKRMQVRL